jgi:hypothetical protein
MQYLDKLRHLLRGHPDRLVYLRRYPDNATWRGWLPQRAIAELELAGNTVQRIGGGYLLNAGGHVQATLRGTIRPIEEVA